MLTLILITTIVLTVLGVAAMAFAPRYTTRSVSSGVLAGWALSWPRIVAGALISLLLAWAVTAAGFSIARGSAVTYYEYWGGHEAKAWVDTTTCTKNGSCRHTYDCDSYWTTETYTDSETYTKPDGTTGTRSVTKTRPVQKWNSCPYVTHEYTYKVSDTLRDTHTMGDHWFPASPSQHRWTGPGYQDARWGFGAANLPGVQTGQPIVWVRAKARLDAGTPGGVTKQARYDNYILASQDDIYAKASDKIDALKADGLLPKVVTGTYDFYRADKVYAVGALSGEKEWQDALLRFNGTFGSEKQGDLHLVVVTDPKVTDPDAYAGAVRAYWQSEDLGKHALSKNGYVVILGSTDGTTVGWARGFSGMPIGNEAVDVAVREDLTGTALTPTAVLGTPAAPASGAVGEVIFDDSIGFDRVQMADYEYLFADIQPGWLARTFIVLVTLFLGMAVWFGLGALPAMAAASTTGRLHSGRLRTGGTPRFGVEDRLRGRFPHSRISGDRFTGDLFERDRSNLDADRKNWERDFDQDFDRDFNSRW